MNPRWNSHRIGGPRLRRIWRLPVGADVRGNSAQHHDKWGRIESVTMAPDPGCADHPAHMHVQMEGTAFLEPGRLHRESSLLPAAAAVHTRVPVRHIGRALVTHRSA
jgi:hypothetical protein